MHFQIALPSMWPVLVEFRSASSEGIADQKEKKTEECVHMVKRMFADMYAGRPD